MNTLTKNHGVIFMVLLAALAPVAHADSTPPPERDSALTSWNKQTLQKELDDVKAEYERVRRMQGEGGLHRRGLPNRLARLTQMTEFHLQLIERLERIEQRMGEMETRASAR